MAFSVCYCVIIAECARYDKKNGRGYPMVDDMFVALLWNNSVSAQRFFCR